jgi:tetratricopeptide (TPR) repeat protein
LLVFACCAAAEPTEPAPGSASSTAAPGSPTTETEPVSPPATEPPSPPSEAPQTEADQYAKFRSLLDAKQYDQAVELARAIADEAARHPEDAESLQIAVMNLATTQYLAGDYVGAEESYQRVIALIEASGRPMRPRLARAEAGLAVTYYAGKRYDLAVERFDRAIALSRRSEGLFNEAQLPLLEKYADALTEINRVKDAQRVYSYGLRIVERKYGAGSLRYADELEKVGRWYASIHAYDVSRGTLRQAIEIIEKSKGENAPELIGPLTALADCDRRQLLDQSTFEAPPVDEQRSALFHDALTPYSPSLSTGSLSSEGQKSLERAVAIAADRPDPSPVQLADVRTQLGDWYQSKQAVDEALPSYQLAWQAAVGQSVDGTPLTEKLFGRPVLLYYEPPDGWDRYYGRPSEDVEVRNVEVEFTVTAQGAVVNPSVVSDDGDPKHGSQTARAVQRARYRPRLEAGKPVDTPGVRLSQPYYLLREAEPDLPADETRPQG